MSTTSAPTITVDVADAPPIPGLGFRRLRDDADYDTIAAIVRAASLHDGLDWVPDAPNLRTEFENEADFDPRVDLVIAEVDGRGVAFGRTVRQVRDGIAVYFSMGTVHPDLRRRGLGRAILRENVRRAREIATRFRDEGGRRLGVWMSERESGLIELLASEGFRPVRWFVTMRRTLDDVPSLPLPDGLELRPVRPEHHRAIFDADNEAFRDHWGHREATEEDFRARFASPDLATSLWRVAWDGDEVAGSVQAWIWRSENEVLGVRRGWLERISVRRPWRRRGLAAALIASALVGLREAGMTEAMLGVDADNPTGATHLYGSLGFEVSERGATYHRDW